MIKPVKLSKLQQTQPIVDKEGRPNTWFQRLLNSNFDNVEYALNQILQIPEIQTSLTALDAATAAAQVAAIAANSAAGTAAAQAAAAQAAANAQKREAALVNSYISPASVLNATPTTIAIAAHTRFYGDGTSAVVNAGSVSTTSPGDTDYIYYSQASRAGGFVFYQVTTSPPVQGGNLHVVGAVTVPAAGTQAGGRGPQAPGYVEP